MSVSIRFIILFYFSSRRRHTRWTGDWSSDVCSSDLPVYDETEGRDGFVSLEVSPHLAHDTAASIGEAKRLWAAVDRPNLFIKIPGTLAGVPAIEELLVDGVNINIT